MTQPGQKAHQPGSEPGHPVLNANDDILIGVDVADPPRGPISGDDCDGKDTGPPPK